MGDWATRWRRRGNRWQLVVEMPAGERRGLERLGRRLKCPIGTVLRLAVWQMCLQFQVAIDRVERRRKN